MTNRYFIGIQLLEGIVEGFHDRLSPVDPILEDRSYGLLLGLWQLS
jgi:hypothetical protein